MIKAISFDAVGTLFYLTKTVGDHYAYVGREVGLDFDAKELERAFHAAWKKVPQRAAIDGPRENDDKGWWRKLVDVVLDQVAPSLSEFDRDNFFEIAYEHFAEAGVWELYPEVPEVLEKLRPPFQLAVISNFDGRLRFILQHLGISKFFTHICRVSAPLAERGIGRRSACPTILRGCSIWIRKRFRPGSVAQLVEQRPFKALVPGSSPGRPTPLNIVNADELKSGKAIRITRDEDSRKMTG